MPGALANELERICWEPDAGPKDPKGLMDVRERFRAREGKGADNGPGPTDDTNPIVLISSGWKSPRRTEFFI